MLRVCVTSRPIDSDDVGGRFHRPRPSPRGPLGAKAQAEAEAAEASKSVAQRLAEAIGGAKSNTMPLNVAQVLRAALAGGKGTVNGAEFVRVLAGLGEVREALDDLTERVGRLERALEDLTTCAERLERVSGGTG
jgi:hypothetical protein